MPVTWRPARFRVQVDPNAVYAHRGTPAVQRMVEYAPATGSLALWVRHRDVDDNGDEIAASNDGLTIRYAPSFERLSLARQTGLVAHEVLHVALRHVPRFLDLRRQLGDVDLELFNICADAIVNSTLAHLSWLEIDPRAVLLDDLLAKVLGIREDPAKALLEWDLERLYRTIDDRKIARVQRAGGDRSSGDGETGAQTMDHESSSGTHGHRSDGPRALRARILAQRGSRDLVPDEEALHPEHEAGLAREWRERVIRGHASDGAHSMLRGLLADLPQTKTPWEQILRTRLARGLSQRRALSWSRPARSYIANQGRMRDGRRMPWEPGWSSGKAVARLAVMIDVSGSIDGSLLDRFASEIAAITRRHEARAVVIIGDDRVRQVTLTEPGLPHLDRIEFHGGGRTDFSPLLEEADRWAPDIGVFLTDLEGPAAYRPAFPILWAVPESQAEIELPFGRKLVLD